MLHKQETPLLPEIQFENPRLATLGIEPMTITELRKKVASKRLTQPQRINFFMLMLITKGHGSHTIDFIDWAVFPGQMLFVRPGQVQQWHAEDDFEALLILIDPSTLPHQNGQIFSQELNLLGLDEWTSGFAVTEEVLNLIETGFRQLRMDFDLFDGEGLDIALIRHELLTLLIRIARLQKQIQNTSSQMSRNQLTYRLFVQAVESSFSNQHSLQYYARRLGYSESTISRACRAAEGRSAKEIISRRITLEAKRLLIHSTASVAEVSHQLGFSETTNFVKFFRRNTGVTPYNFKKNMLQVKVE